MSVDVQVKVIDPATARTCGEGCDRPAVIDVDGSDEVEGYTYCGACLLRLVLLGAEVIEAVAAADARMEATS